MSWSQGETKMKSEVVLPIQTSSQAYSPLHSWLGSKFWEFHAITIWKPTSTIATIPGLNLGVAANQSKLLQPQTAAAQSKSQCRCLHFWNQWRIDAGSMWQHGSTMSLWQLTANPSPEIPNSLLTEHFYDSYDTLKACAYIFTYTLTIHLAVPCWKPFLAS